MVYMHLHTVPTDNFLSFALVAAVETVSVSVVTLLAGLNNLVPTFNWRWRRNHDCNVRNEVAAAPHLPYPLLQFVANEHLTIHNLTLELIIN